MDYVHVTEIVRFLWDQIKITLDSRTIGSSIIPSYSSFIKSIDHPRISGILSGTR